MRVLVAIENSEFSEAVTDAVASRPWWGDTEFVVMSIVPIMVPALNDFSPHYHEIRTIQQAELKETHKLVDKTLERLKKALPYCCITGVVEEGNICDKLVLKAAQWQADVIMLGSHGRQGLSRFFLGSVAEAVVNRAPCSVEIVKLVKKPVADKKANALDKAVANDKEANKQDKFSAASA